MNKSCLRALSFLTEQVLRKHSCNLKGRGCAFLSNFPVFLQEVFSKTCKGLFRTLSNIEDEALCEKSFQPFTIVTKRSILDG